MGDFRAVDEGVKKEKNKRSKWKIWKKLGRKIHYRNKSSIVKVVTNVEECLPSVNP